jgi:hypothetical protein
MDASRIQCNNHARQSSPTFGHTWVRDPHDGPTPTRNILCSPAATHERESLVMNLLHCDIGSAHGGRMVRAAASSASPRLVLLAFLLVISVTWMIELSLQTNKEVKPMGLREAPLYHQSHKKQYWSGLTETHKLSLQHGWDRVVVGTMKLLAWHGATMHIATRALDTVWWRKTGQVTTRVDPTEPDGDGAWGHQCYRLTFGEPRGKSRY